MYRKERRRCLVGIAICVVGFILGLFSLEFLSKLENPPLGNTFYIIVGCTMMVLSLLGMYLLFKHIQYLKKTEFRRKNNPIVFLNDDQKKKHD